MKFFNKQRVRDITILSAVVMLVQVLLTRFIYPLFGKTTQTLFAITPTTAVTSPTIGNKVLGLLSGILPFSFGGFKNWIAIFIGAFVLLFLGYWIYEQKWAWKGKNLTQRLFAILLYGSLVLYVFLLITNIAAVATIALPLLVGIAINYFAIAFVVVILAKRLKFLRI